MDNKELDVSNDDFFSPDFSSCPMTNYWKSCQKRKIPFVYSLISRNVLKAFISCPSQKTRSSLPWNRRRKKK